MKSQMLKIMRNYISMYVLQINDKMNKQVIGMNSKP